MAPNTRPTSVILFRVRRCLEAMAMALLVGDYPYVATIAWEDAIICVLIAIITYLCGVLHGSIGMFILQHYRKANSTTTSTQANESQPMNDAQQEAEVPTETTPMPQQSSQTLGVPIAIYAGFTDHTYAYHRGNNPCTNFRQMKATRIIDSSTSLDVKKRFVPCEVCWPRDIPRIDM